jgi:hypothetical protein
MDAKKFRAFLDEVAVVKEVGVDIGPNGCAKKKKTKIITEIIENEFGDEEEVEVEIDVCTTNPTMPCVIAELKARHAICELGCGEIVTNQIIQTKMIQTPEWHWRTTCKNCNKTVGPDGELIFGQMAAQNAFSKWFKDKQNK